ncbi:hypothetical protein D3C76_1591720 [compost metagenome]
MARFVRASTPSSHWTEGELFRAPDHAHVTSRPCACGGKKGPPIAMPPAVDSSSTFVTSSAFGTASHGGV